MALSATTDVSVLRRLDAQVDALVRADALALASRWPDPSLPGHVHESFRQFHAGVPVYGGGLSRQLATGVIVSIFGTIYQALRRLACFGRPGRWKELAPLMGKPINEEVVLEHWNDALRLTASIKTVSVTPSAMLRKLGAYR